MKQRCDPCPHQSKTRSAFVSDRVHTSELLAKLVEQAPRDKVDLEWLVSHLERQSFGLLLLILGLAIVVPGVGTVATLAISIPAIEMILGRDRPTLPHLLARRPFATEQFTKWAKRLLPYLRSFEQFSRCRWRPLHPAIKRAVGFVILLLAIAGIWPIPVINLIPGLIIILISFAYLQDDGLLLTISLMAAVGMLVVFGLIVWTSADAIIKWS